MSEQSRRTVLITGASGGIGSETARQFARKGFRIAVHYFRGTERADRVLRSLAGAGHVKVKADLSSTEDVLGLSESVFEAFGRLDVLVNNAGIAELRSFADCDFETWSATWRRVLVANLLGPANLAFCVAKHMVRQGGGRIVNVSSRGAFVGEPDQPWYGASKAGLNSMAQSLAKALAAQNVLVYTVAPGFVETSMSAASLAGEGGERIRSEIPLGRVTSTQEVAETILFLATSAPPSMTGAILDINGASYLRT